MRSNRNGIRSKLPFFERILNGNEMSISRNILNDQNCIDSPLTFRNIDTKDQSGRSRPSPLSFPTSIAHCSHSSRRSTVGISSKFLERFAEVSICSKRRGELSIFLVRIVAKNYSLRVRNEKRLVFQRSIIVKIFKIESFRILDSCYYILKKDLLEEKFLKELFDVKNIFERCLIFENLRRMFWKDDRKI